MKSIITLIAIILSVYTTNAQTDLLDLLSDSTEISVNSATTNTKEDKNVYGRKLDILYKDYYNKCLKIVIYHDKIKKEIYNNLSEKSDSYKHYSKDLDLKFIKKIDDEEKSALKAETKKFGIKLKQLYIKELR